MLLTALLILSSATTLTIDLGAPGVAVSPSLYGLMTEEINHSYDGGLYAELVRNRAFEDDPALPVGWTPVGPGASVELDRSGRMSENRQTSLRVRGGAANEGYWGIPIRPRTTYRLQIWAKADAPGPITASLESRDGTKVFARAKASGFGAEWAHRSVILRTGPDIVPTADARLVLRTGARTTWLGFVSLFPPTFHGRPNGNRPDLMKLLVEMHPKFLRLPGGNYLEGNSFAERFQFAETLGPIEFRKGHRSPWGYRSTDGMGLLEYLEWCEDMHARPLLALFAGYALRGQVIKAGHDLEPYVNEGLNEIEYAVGSPETRWGAERVRDGHPKPFDLVVVEIGNEDGFDRSGSYEGRFVQFYDAIKAKYPRLDIVSTTGGKDPLGRRFPIMQRKPDLIDEHYYSSTWEMMAMATKYDGYDRRGPKIFVGEWASQDVPEPWRDAAHKGPTPNQKCAIADAAFLTGLERNSDLVKMSCYAPLLVNVNPGGRQWAVNLIGYDALSSFGSPSYYVQRMFGESLGTRTAPATLSGIPEQRQGNQTLPGIFASATCDARGLYLKLVNALPTKQAVQVHVRRGRLDATGSATILAGELEAMNTIAEPRKVAPVTRPLTGLTDGFTQNLPPHSVTVLRLRYRRRP